MRDLYFKFSPSSSSVVNLPKGMYLEKKYPCKTFHDLLWQLFSLFLGKQLRFTRWILKDDRNRILSVDHTIGRVYQFPFLSKECIHLGPGETPVHLRGLGYHTLLLRCILAENKDRSVYTIVSPDNEKSIRVVEKIGFQRIGYGHTTKYLKRHVIDEWV